MRKKSKNKKKNFSQRDSFWLPLKKKIWAISFFLSGLILLLSFFQKGGLAGQFFFSFFNLLVGKVVFFLPSILILASLVSFGSNYSAPHKVAFLAILVFIVSLAGLFETLTPGQKEAGLLGYIFSWPLVKFFGSFFSQIFFISFILISLFLFWHLIKERPTEILEKKKEERAKKPLLIKKFFLPKFKVQRIEREEKLVSPPKAPVSEPKEVPSKGLLPFVPPPLELLEEEKETPTVGDIKMNSAIIKKTLENFGIRVEMTEVNIGPTVSQYTLKPAEGVKLSKITALSNDLALALASHPIRIEAPIPGKSQVGIEIPNKIRSKVRLRNLISHLLQNAQSRLMFVLGKDVAGNPCFADLSRMPHLLVAGSTGSGKTVKADTFLFTERGMLTFEELCPLPLNSEIDFRIKLVTRDGIEETAKNYNNGICQFYKISTRRGYQIEATAEHPLWVRNKDGSQSWKPASLIKKGDELAISLGPALFGNKIDLSDFKLSKIKTDQREICFPSKMTPQLAQFLGLLTTDGDFSFEKRGIPRLLYSQANPQLLSLYKKLLGKLFGLSQFIEKRRGLKANNKVIEIEVNSLSLKEFLSYLGMKSGKASQKEMPRAIREAPKEIVVSYLKSLFDNDGYLKKDSIELFFASQRLLSQVQIMLLNFGIVSSLKSKKGKDSSQKEYFRLSLYGQDARKFVKEIGFLREEKYQKIKSLFGLRPNPHLEEIDQKYLPNLTCLTNRRWQSQPAILLPKDSFSSLTSSHWPERRLRGLALERILIYQPIAQEKESQALKKIFPRNFYWDKVEKISQTSGIGYDFFVPGSDSFVGNGFVNHNTIFLNSIILSLIYQNPPEILKFILIDPKRVEFPIYQELPHLLVPVIFDAQRTINALKCLILEMERRFDFLAREKFRDIASYNQSAFKNGHPVLPYIILIIDELADLMAARGREIEGGIVRLAQMARAVGIHLVVATQRPSVEVITGLIKANITSRVTFQVASQVDSRTVLDTAGAEKLLGQGDLLFLSAENPKPKRIQSPFVSEKEVKKVVEFLKSKYQKEKIVLPFELQSLESFLEEGLAEKEELPFPEKETAIEDPLYFEAKKIVIEAKKASASLLQRKLKIGYARAARLIDLLEAKGVVGPAQGAKPREVYLSEEDGENWQKV